MIYSGTIIHIILGHDIQQFVTRQVSQHTRIHPCECPNDQLPYAPNIQMDTRVIFLFFQFSYLTGKQMSHRLVTMDTNKIPKDDAKRIG